MGGDGERRTAIGNYADKIQYVKDFVCPNCNTCSKIDGIPICKEKRKKKERKEKKLDTAWYYTQKSILEHIHRPNYKVQNHTTSRRKQIKSVHSFGFSINI